jgi:hypothetical protein
MWSFPPTAASCVRPKTGTIEMPVTPGKATAAGDPGGRFCFPVVAGGQPAKFAAATSQFTTLQKAAM